MRHYCHIYSCDINCAFVVYNKNKYKGMLKVSECYIFKPITHI